jgi:hypothetical protein
LKSYEYNIDLVKKPNFDIFPARSVPYAIRDAVKRELDTMTEMKVIRPIQEATLVVSAMVNGRNISPFLTV